MTNKLSYDWHKFHKAIQNYYPPFTQPTNEPPPKKNKYFEWMTIPHRTYTKKTSTQHINQPTSLAMRAKSLFSLGEGEE
jgi:hypothetical protein